MVSVASVITTCTARHMYGFLNDAASEAMLKMQHTEVRQHLNTAKLHRIVNVFAFLIEGSQAKSAKQLEEFGFKRVADYHDYKYPTTSKRLWMYSLDMNTYKPPVEAPKPSTNPFAARPVTREGILPITRTPNHRSRGLTYNFASNPRSIRRQYLHRLMLNDPSLWPRGVWVDIPLELDRCPTFLRGKRVEVQLYGGVLSGRPAACAYQWGVPAGDNGRIIRVRRL